MAQLQEYVVDVYGLLYGVFYARVLECTGLRLSSPSCETKLSSHCRNGRAFDLEQARKAFGPHFNRKYY